MKNYRSIIPIALVVFMGLSIYMRFSENTKVIQQYNKYLEDARNFAEDGIIKDSLFSYNNALNMTDSLEIRLEMANMLVEQGEITQAIEVGETIISKYKNSAAGYIFLLKQYIAKEEYRMCFELYDQFMAMKINSPEFDELMGGIEYKYEIKGTSYTEVGRYHSGLCAIMKDGLWGYADTAGSIKITQQFLEGLAFVGVNSEDGVQMCAPILAVDGSRYYIDDSGNKKHIIKNISNCTYLGIYNGEVLVAGDNGKYAYYNIDFEKISQDYTYATTMNEGFAAVQIGEEWYVIDSSFLPRGEAYEGFVYDDINCVFRNGRAIAMQNDMYYLINTEAVKVSPEAYEDAKPFYDKTYAAVKQSGKWGFIDVDGNMVLEPQYEDALSFCNGYAAVKQDGKWGFIDMKGNLVIPCEFDGASSFNDSGNVYIKNGEMWELLSLYKDNY